MGERMTAGKAELKADGKEGWVSGGGGVGEWGRRGG